MDKLWETAREALPPGGHGISHTKRVHALCVRIAREEGLSPAETRIAEAAAILHDIARPLEDSGAIADHAAEGARMAYARLIELGWAREDAEAVSDCIASHRFKGANRPQTLAARVLSDADKLDCIGCVGVARSFMIAGEMGQMIWSDEPPAAYMAAATGENGRVSDLSRHTPNLEYHIKLKLIPERLYTESAKRLARERMRRMDAFFAALEAEINGREDDLA